MTNPAQSGKGDTPRPIQDLDQYRKNFEQAFGERKLPLWERDEDGNLVD